MSLNKISLAAAFVSFPLVLVADPLNGQNGDAFVAFYQLIAVAGVVALVSVVINLITIIGVSVSRSGFWYFMTGISLLISAAWCILFFVLMLQSMFGRSSGRESALFLVGFMFLLGMCILYINLLRKRGNAGSKGS